MRRGRRPGAARRGPQGSVRRRGGRGALSRDRQAALALAHQHAEPPRGLGGAHRRRRAVAALRDRGAQQLVPGLAHGADQQRGDPLHRQHHRAQLHDAVHLGGAGAGWRPHLLLLPDSQRDPAAHDHDDLRGDPAAAGHRGDRRSSAGRRGITCPGDARRS